MQRINLSMKKYEYFKTKIIFMFQVGTVILLEMIFQEK